VAAIASSIPAPATWFVGQFATDLREIVPDFAARHPTQAMNPDQ
jgi:hypothetical protein